MAITLNITLTTNEQAKASEIIDLLLPGKTNQQKINLLEMQAKRLLVEDLKNRAYMHRQRLNNESVIAAKEADEAVLTPIFTDLDPAPSSTSPPLIPATPSYPDPPAPTINM